MTSSLLLRPLEGEILVQETAVPHAFRRLLLGRPAGRTWPAVCISHPRGWVLVLYRLSGMGWEDLWAAGRRDFTEDEMLVVRSSLRTTKVPEPKCRGISPRRPETTVLHVSYCKVLTGLSGARGDTPSRVPSPGFFSEDMLLLETILHHTVHEIKASPVCRHPSLRVLVILYT